MHSTCSMTFTASVNDKDTSFPRSKAGTHSGRNGLWYLRQLENHAISALCDRYSKHVVVLILTPKPTTKYNRNPCFPRVLRIRLRWAPRSVSKCCTRATAVDSAWNLHTWPCMWFCWKKTVPSVFFRASFHGCCSTSCDKKERKKELSAAPSTLYRMFSLIQPHLVLWVLLPLLINNNVSKIRKVPASTCIAQSRRMMHSPHGRDP